MNQISIKDLTGKSQILNIPSSWYELNLDQFIKVETSDRSDVLGLFSILAGVPLEVPENSTDKKLEKVIWQSLSFLGENVDWSDLKPPKAFAVGEHVFQVPKEFGKMMIGQKIMIAQTVKTIEDLIEKMPKLLAIIFLPQFTGGKFESSRIDELADLMRSTIGMDAYAIAKGFFLLSPHLSNYGLSGLGKYQKRKVQTRKISREWLRLRGSQSSLNLNRLTP